jgi:hypothetical protein
MAESAEERKRRLKAAANRRYREAHPEEYAEQRRRWREQNKEHRRAYQRQWRARNLERSRELNRESMRRKAVEQRKAQERRDRNAARARERYHADVEASRAKARAYLAARKAADPDGYREAKKRRNQAWRERHKDEIDARRREKYRLDPSRKQTQAAQYYERHAEERRDYRRRYYQEHREQELARQRQWRRRERRRIDAGLPVRRLHRTTPAEREQHAREADAFFARPVTPQLKERLAAELRTPPELIAAFRRECARIRAAQYALRNPETSRRQLTRQQAEEARMDAIARAINERLRTTPRPRRDLAAHTPTPTTPPRRGMGL